METPVSSRSVYTQRMSSGKTDERFAGLDYRKQDESTYLCLSTFAEAELFRSRRFICINDASMLLFICTKNHHHRLLMIVMTIVP